MIKSNAVQYEYRFGDTRKFPFLTQDRLPEFV